MNPIIEDAAYLAARVIMNELQAQAPSAKIGEGIVVLPTFTGYGSETEVDFEIFLADDVFYGKFLDSGTLDQYDPNPDAEWRPNPGKGEGGILPRYWTNLSEEIQDRVNMIIEDALSQAKEQELEEQLDKEFN